MIPKLMTRDFAKKSGNKRSRRKGASKPTATRAAVPGWLWLIAGLAIGGMGSLLYYLQTSVPEEKLPADPITKAASSKSSQIDQPKPAKQESASPAEEEPKALEYRFHDELVNKEIIIPEEELIEDVPDNVQYVMPCGSFRDQQHAEELRAKIAFQGFESAVNPIDVKSGRWYRVQLGPYQKKRQAESIRHRLQTIGIIDCKIWRQSIK